LAGFGLDSILEVIGCTSSVALIDSGSCYGNNEFVVDVINIVVSIIIESVDST